MKILTKTKNASEVVFKIDSTFDSNTVQNDKSDGLDLRDASVHKKLLRDYYNSHALSEDDWLTLDNMIDVQLSEIAQTD